MSKRCMSYIETTAVVRRIPSTNNANRKGGGRIYNSRVTRDFKKSALLQFKQGILNKDKNYTPTPDQWKGKPLSVVYRFYLSKSRKGIKPDLDNLVKYPQDILFEALDGLYRSIQFNDNQIAVSQSFRYIINREDEEIDITLSLLSHTYPCMNPNPNRK